MIKLVAHHKQAMVLCICDLSLIAATYRWAHTYHLHAMRDSVSVSVTTRHVELSGGTGKRNNCHADKCTVTDRRLRIDNPQQN